MIEYIIDLLQWYLSTRLTYVSTSLPQIRRFDPELYFSSSVGLSGTTDTVAGKVGLKVRTPDTF